MPTSQPSADEVIAALCAFVSDTLLPPGEKVEPDDSLLDFGIESFALIEIVLFLERRFSRALPLNLLTPENTRSIDALARCYSGCVS